MNVRGMFNVQYAIKDEVVYVLEVNPRASRTVPYVSKATGHQMAGYAALIAAGKTLEEIGFLKEPHVDGFFVKEAVLPFQKFPGVDVRLGPEMRSTGEVMGHASNFGHAFAKAQMSASAPLPASGTAFISVNPHDQGGIVKIARDLHRMDFKLVATPGTAEWLKLTELPVETINRVSHGSPHVLDAIREGKIDLIINTPLGGQSHNEGNMIRNAAHMYGIPLVTTLSAAQATVQGIKALNQKPLKVLSLQAHHGV